MALRRRESRLTFLLGALAVATCCDLLSTTFVAIAGRTPAPRAAVAVRSTADYTGFVPDMQRRQLMNFVTLAATAVPVAILAGGYLWYFVPQTGEGSGGSQLAGDENGTPILLAEWVANHKPNDRELVQGLKGDPTYLISTDDGIKGFAINSICTHLGCVVPWDRAANKFICPCHGSQYDEAGKVVRGPAPLPLALAHANVQEGKVALSPWTEADFRTGLAPWWAS